MQNSPASSTYRASDAELKPLPPEDWPSLDHIETEDGAPVDNVFSEKQMRLLTESLYASWKTPRSFVAMANVGLFYGVDLAPLVPDTLLSMNVRMPENLSQKINRSYFVWKYGKPPEVIVEVVSNRKRKEDSEKLEAYATIRVNNYVIYDPEQFLGEAPLRVYSLLKGKLVPNTTSPPFFPEVNLGLTIWSGNYEGTDANWLRWTDPAGKLILSGSEAAIRNAKRAAAEKKRATAEKNRADLEKKKAESEKKKAESEKKNAESEKKRADLETKRADSEMKRADSATKQADQLANQNERLLELLRQHNLDPDSLSD